MRGLKVKSRKLISLFFLRLLAFPELYLYIDCGIVHIVSTPSLYQLRCDVITPFIRVLVHDGQDDLTPYPNIYDRDPAVNREGSQVLIVYM